MLRHEKVADRAGSLVTECVRALTEAAEGRAERVRQAAADEAHRLDSQRMQAAARIVSEMEGLEGALGRLRQHIQSDHAVEGYAEEDRLIEASYPEEPVIAEEEAPDAEGEPDPASEQRGSPEPEPEPDPDQGSRFSILRRRPWQAEPSADPEETESEPEQQAGTYVCAVCGRSFTGDESELRSLGWVLSDSGEVTCSDCLGAGWLRLND